MQIRLGHSPDADDAFMFWALASGRVDRRGFEFEHVLRDIQTLNEWALEGRLETTAISLHAYPFVQDRYVLLPHGASMGAGYGPIVVAREPLALEDLADLEIAVPGRMTTAFLVLRMAIGDFRYREVPFDRILDEVKAGDADVGLIIHEGQLTYADEGLEKVLDLGEWWLLEMDCRCRSAPTSPGAISVTRCSRSCRRCFRIRSAPASTIETRRWPTRWSSAAVSSRTSQTASSACTSTT